MFDINFDFRESVRKILIEVDPDGVKARSHRRMKRRQYICKVCNLTVYNCWSSLWRKV